MQMMMAAGENAAQLRHLHGAAFEQAIMGAMIPHHQAAVAMARLELSHGICLQAKALAEQVITGQTREIAQMTSWLGTWYHLSPAQAAQRAPASLRNTWGCPALTDRSDGLVRLHS